MLFRSFDESYDAVKGGLQDASPQASAAFQQAMDQIMPQLDQVSDEQLDMLLQAFQYIQDHPEQYKQLVKELIEGGVLEEGMLPEEYDPEILAVLVMVFLEARKQRQAGNEREAQMGMPQPPATMARGGIAEAARMVASSGRGGDTMLAHINKDEAKLLRKRGGAGTINPATGLPEYGWNPIKSVVNAVKGVVGGVVSAVKSVVNAVKSVVQSPIGRILGTIALAAVLGPTALGATLGTAGTAALSAGTITALGGGNLKDVLRSAATSYLGAPGGPVENFIGNAGAAMGVTNAAGQAAINAGITGAGVGLLTGQNLKDSIKSGLIAGAIQGGITGADKGFGAQVPGAANAPGGAPANPLTPGEVNKQIQTGGAPASTDPLGDFIQQNDRFREMANTPAREAGAAQQAAAAKFSPVPTIGESASRIGGGLADIAQGNFSQGFDTLKGGVSDLFAPSKLTPDQLAQSPAFQSARAGGATYTEALKAASDAYNPGALRTYGPGIVAGLAATGAMGGFEPGSLPPSQMAEKLSGTPGEDLIKANPSKYITQNLPGVQYDATGNIVGSKPWSPSATMADVRVPASSLGGGGQYNFASVQPPTGAMYTPGMGTLGQSPQVYQPYNTSAMYGNLMQPRYAAEGGIMAMPMQPQMGRGLASLAEGGYPRRTGQISGPGTEKSDSIPAMLSDGEFVMTAKAVRGAGKGSRRAGAKKMYALMHQLERNASRG